MAADQQFIDALTQFGDNDQQPGSTPGKREVLIFELRYKTLAAINNIINNTVPQTERLCRIDYIKKWQADQVANKKKQGKELECFCVIQANANGGQRIIGMKIRAMLSDGLQQVKPPDIGMMMDQHPITPPCKDDQYLVFINLSRPNKMYVDGIAAFPHNAAMVKTMCNPERTREG